MVPASSPGVFADEPYGCGIEKQPGEDGVPTADGFVRRGGHAMQAAPATTKFIHPACILHPLCAFARTMVTGDAIDAKCRMARGCPGSMSAKRQPLVVFEFRGRIQQLVTLPRIRHEALRICRSDNASAERRMTMVKRQINSSRERTRAKTYPKKSQLDVMVERVISKAAHTGQRDNQNHDNGQPKRFHVIFSRAKAG